MHIHQKALYIMREKQVSSLITYHRKKAGLSQTDLAKHASVSRTIVQDIESGHLRCSLSKFLAVLKILNIQLEPQSPLIEEWKKHLNKDE